MTVGARLARRASRSTRCGVAVDQPLPRRTIEQRNRRQALIGVAAVLRLLHGGAQGRTLRTIAHRSRTRLSQVFLRGLDIRHGKLPSR